MSRHVISITIEGPYPLRFGRVPFAMTGEQAQTARERIGLTRDQYADVMGLTHETLRIRENGKRRVPGESAALLWVLNELNATIVPTMSERRPNRVRSQADTCLHGHSYTPENTRIRRDGFRICRACNRDRCRAARERQRTSTPTSEDQ